MQAAQILIVCVLLLTMMNTHATSAQAITGPTYTVRLINTLSSVSNSSEGRLEIYYNGTWGTVCDDAFTNDSARVACASLGYGYIGEFIGNRHIGGTGKIWLDDVTCTGVEYGIENCPHRTWGSHDCDHGEDVSIRCGTSETFAIEFRLINSLSSVNNPHEGRLEIFYSGVWGTICDDSFTNASARVACNSLGYGYLGTVITNRHGSGIGSIWLDEVTCDGTEQNIDKCSHGGWGSHDCSHYEDVAISCGATPRLVNSLSSLTNPNEGRLEIYYAGEWGTVCDDSFTNISARVACQSLGFGDTGTFVANRHGSGTGRIWLDDISCTGTELGVERCVHNTWGTNDCSHSEDVSIRCEPNSAPTSSDQGTDRPEESDSITDALILLLLLMNNAQEAAREYNVRLINTLSSECDSREGRLEIYYNGTWGTVCDDGFTNDSARVACASLGYGYFGTFTGNRHGGGTGKVWLDDVTCTGVEYGIETCPHTAWGSHNCAHAEDVSIRCEAPGDFAIRLVNSLSSVKNPKEGRLEIFYSGVWGTICDNSFTNASARVACNSLGYGNYGTVITNRHGEGSGSIWLDEITCSGTERSIDRCSHGGWGSHDCTHSEDVAISCGATSRLVNSLSSVNNPEEGRLEIYYAGEWGTVCDDSFTNISARVACQSLGFGYTGTFVANRHGNATGRIWLDDTRCTGTELGVDRCVHNAWGTNDCSHSEDVSIRCGNTPDYTVRLVKTSDSTATEGRLEIYYSGIWGTVCDDGFTNVGAQVACASLGFGYTGRFIGNRHGSGTGQIWLDDVVCRGDESGIELCQHSSWSKHNCFHYEDVSIICEE